MSNRLDDGFVDTSAKKLTQIEEVLLKLDALRTDGNIVIGDRPYAIDLERDFSIDENLLSEEFSTQGARFAYYAAMFARSKHAVDFAKYQLEQREATVATTIRESFEADSKKPPTIPAVDALVKVDDKVQEAKINLMATKHTLDLVKGFMEASRMKSDMLMQMGAHVRAEMGNIDISMRENPVKDMRNMAESFKEK